MKLLKLGKQPLKNSRGEFSLMMMMMVMMDLFEMMVRMMMTLMKKQPLNDSRGDCHW